MHKVKIISKKYLTRDILEIRTEKPYNFKFIPGHSIMISINNPSFTSPSLIKRPYNFTSLNDDSYLEFIIKLYRERNGLSTQFEKLNIGEMLILEEMFGSHRYVGPGIFIAGGVGIAPFIAIFRQLKKDNAIEGNTLLFSSKTSKDIILEKELKELLGENCIFTLTKENNSNRRIDKLFLIEKVSNFNQHFYICGPDSFARDIKQMISEIKKEREQFDWFIN
ncbi:flavodoxin reductase [Candidatus Pacearchaeota archaeon]|nr:flavodoxin reductase [Candidatus Pacearchaeota archaeon]